MHSKIKTKRLPNELVEQILSKLPMKRLLTTMQVNKNWMKLSKRIVYRHVRFTSVKQRERFFACMQRTHHRSSEATSPTKRKQSAAITYSGNMPPPLRIIRKASFQAHHAPSENANLICSLDFGLSPKHLQPYEPDLPMSTKAVLGSPNRTVSSPTSPTAQTPVTRSIRRVNNMTLESPIITRSMIRAGLTKRNESVAHGQKVESTTSVSELLPSMPSTCTTAYGAWNHRFVSPLLPLIGSLIPNLKELSICGCHVNAADFGVMLQSMHMLKRLDISYSTLKSDGVELIGRYCRSKLGWLNVSGIFKLGRNKKYALLSIVAHCDDLAEIIAHDCPEIYQETLDECVALCNGRIAIKVDAALSYTN